MDYPISDHSPIKCIATSANRLVNRFVFILLIVKLGIPTVQSDQLTNRTINNFTLINRSASNQTNHLYSSVTTIHNHLSAPHSNRTLELHNSAYNTSVAPSNSTSGLTTHETTELSHSFSRSVGSPTYSNASKLLLSVIEIDKLNDVNNKSANNATVGTQQSPINFEAKANGTIISRTREQMSFIDSIGKKVNLANDLNTPPNKRNRSTSSSTVVTNHRDASSASIILLKVKKLSKLKSSSNLSSTTEASLAPSTSPVASVLNESDASIALTASSTVPNFTHKIVKIKIQAITQPITKQVSNRTMIHVNRTAVLFTNRTEQTSKQSLNSGQHPPSERLLVYPVQTNQSHDPSLSAQSKRAPHYLEEKFRAQALSTSTVSPDKNERLLDHTPTPILDTRPLVEDIDSELNLRALDERLISEDELMHHHGSSSIEDIGSYEYGAHHSLHHLSAHHSAKHELHKYNQTIDSSWLEHNFPKNCSCDLVAKWPEVNEQSRKTLNCSTRALTDYPTLTSELGKHVERLSLSNNAIKTLQLSVNTFHYEKLTELDLSNNQLQHLTANTYKHIQHPVVEFHPSHHHLHKEEDSAIRTPYTASTHTEPPATGLNSTDEPSGTTSAQLKTTNNPNRQHLFTHCHRLRILVLSGNDLSTLSTGSFRGLKRLRKLYLDSSAIRFIEKNAFLGANELRLLSLRSNELTTIHSDMFQHMINLRVLDLSENSLTYLGAGIFNSLVALQALHLGHNKLRQLSFQCFSGLDGLQLLTLNSNQLQSVPRFALQPLKKLKILNMSGNPINRILEDDFSHSFIQLLLLNHLSQLQHVARFAFWDLPYLDELQITHCAEFAHLDEQAIVGAPVLHRLRLDHNAISQLDDRLLENLARMTIAARRQLKVYLAGNPFVCDCFLKPVYLCARDQAQCKIELPNHQNITCSLKGDESKQSVTPSTQIHRIDELSSGQLPNECAPNFVSVITPINVTIVRRLRSKLTLSCKAQGIPTPNVYWLQPSGEIHKEKLLTRHGHDLMESDLLTLPHAFQNDDIGEQSPIEQHLLANQATAAFTSGVLMSTSSLALTLPSTAHHGSSTLRVNHLTPNDAGLYTCVAENRLGSIRSHVQLITQQLKIELKAENTSTNFITVNWQVNSIFNPPLSELLGNATNSTDSTDGSDAVTRSSGNSTANQRPLSLFKVDFDEAIINAKNEQNLNLLDYQLLYKTDAYGTDDDSNKQTSAETLGSERIFESNKFFASYESVQINRQLKLFTVARLRPNTRYKICIAVREPRPNELDYSPRTGGLFRKRSIRRSSFKRLKRNLISVESASYLAIGCLHSETAHAAFYARNILKVDKLRLPAILSTAASTAIRFSLICSISAIVIILFLSAYHWTRQYQRRAAYETPRKTLLSLAGYPRPQSNASNTTNTPFSTPLHGAAAGEPQQTSPLMRARY